VLTTAAWSAISTVPRAKRPDVAVQLTNWLAGLLRESHREVVCNIRSLRSRYCTLWNSLRPSECSASLRWISWSIRFATSGTLMRPPYCS